MQKEGQSVISFVLALVGALFGALSLWLLSDLGFERGLIGGLVFAGFGLFLLVYALVLAAQAVKADPGSAFARHGLILSAVFLGTLVLTALVVVVILFMPIGMSSRY